MTEVKQADAASRKSGVSSPPTASFLAYVCPRLVFVVLAVAIGLGCWLEYKVPSNIDTIIFEVPPMPELKNELSINYRLTGAEKILENVLEGPESFAVAGGTFYTGTANGTIVRFNSASAHIYGPLISHCDEPPCSRPLGMRFDAIRRRLVIADAYLGVYEIPQQTGVVTRIFPFPGDNSFKVTFFNDLEILPDGRIIVVEASTKYPLHEFDKDAAEGRPNGRVLLIDPSKKTWVELHNGLHFANGVQLHSDGKSVIVAESFKFRLWKIALDGSGAAHFGPVLPGTPDNIRPSPRGGYWVPMFLARFKGSPHFMDLLGRWPKVRANIYKLLTKEQIEKLAIKKHTIIVRVGEDGKILESLHDPTGKFVDVTEVQEVDGHLYLGSISAPYVGKLPLA